MNLTVRKKIYILIAIQIVVMGPLCLGVFMKAEDIKLSYDALVSHDLVFLEKGHAMQNDVIQIQQWLTDISATKGLDGLNDGFDEAKTRYDSLVSKLNDFADDFKILGREKELKSIEEIRNRVELYYSTGKKMANGYIKDGTEQGNRLMGDFDQSAQSLFEVFNPFLDETRRAVKSKETAVGKSLQQLKTATVIVSIGSVLAYISVGLWLGIGIVKKLNLFAREIKDMSKDGTDLTKLLPLSYVDCSKNKNCGKKECASFNKKEPCWALVGSMQLNKSKIQCPGVLSGKVKDCSDCNVFKAVEKDELDTLANWINIFIARMRELASWSVNATDELASGAIQLSATTAEIASSNEEISAQSASIASGAEEMSATVEHVAQNTELANDASNAAREAANAGALVVDQAALAMREIASVVEQATSTVRSLGDQSNKIGVVLEVIEEIADQTNLLALNAAIEAARAGENGRGFAVVADEVRKLAEKTVKATQEISHTITKIQDESSRAVHAMEQGQVKVSKGTELGAHLGEAMREIDERASQSSEKIQQIAAATRQLSATIREMAKNMEEIAFGVQQNSSATIEIARTSEALSGKAEELKEISENFKV